MNNEAIAKVMGWEIIWTMDGWLYTDKKSGKRLFMLADLSEIEFAKLLQQRMAQDGWNILSLQTGEGFNLTAFKDCFKAHITEVINFEPAAIVALFEKVYSIA